jgi:hypothetical protein
MSKTITKEVYTFKELIELEKEGRVSTKTLEHVREKLREWATDGSWWYECVFDNWKPALDQIGFENADISFSGFWSQGDGASFTASIDVRKLVDFLNTKVEPSNVIAPFPGQDGSTNPKEDFRPWIAHKTRFKGWTAAYRHLPKLADYLDAKVERTCHREVHKRSCRTAIQIQGGQHLVNRLEALVAVFELVVEDLRLDLCRAIYNDLEEEHDWRTADEQLIEDCEANQWHFDTSGRIE